MLRRRREREEGLDDDFDHDRRAKRGEERRHTPRGEMKIKNRNPLDRDWDETASTNRRFLAQVAPMDDLLGEDVKEALASLRPQQTAGTIGAHGSLQTQPGAKGDKKNKAEKQKAGTVEGSSFAQRSARQAVLRMADVRELPKSVRHLLAGAFSGICSKTATAPIEFVRMKLMVGGTGQSATQIISSTMKNQGIGGFFYGNLADCIRVAPSKAVQLASFDAFKRALTRIDKETGQEIQPGPFLTTVAGGLAGVTSTTVCFPLETLRTRLAVNSSYNGMVDAVLKISKAEGPLAFYAGLGPSVLGVIPYAGVNLAMYDGLRWTYCRSYNTDRVPKSVALVCGSLSGVISSTATFPLEVVRRRMMVGAAYKNTLDALLVISKTEGFSTLFAGCMLNWVKLAPAAGISFYMYEYGKEVLLVN